MLAVVYLIFCQTFKVGMILYILQRVYELGNCPSIVCYLILVVLAGEG